MRSSIKRKRKNSKIISSAKKSRFKNLFITHFFQIIFLSGVSSTLILFFINNAWTEISISQVQIKGNINFDKEEILDSAGIDFPQPLLEVIPKRIENNLTKRLSLQAASVRRHIFPPEIIIEVLERTPIAYAQRIGPKGTEKGMIDKNANWIPIQIDSEETKRINLFVNGWRNSHRELIAFLIQQQENLDGSLEKINLSPAGEISLQTKDFESINLGSNPDQLSNQIKVLSYLIGNLPARFKNQSGATIDLRDLSKPELQTGKVN